jgi:hypothetical protein
MTDTDSLDLYDNFFENFAHSVAAVRVLLGTANEVGSFIEGLMLYATIVDAVLRNLVALETAPRDDQTRHLDARYFVHDDSKWMNERRIYSEARDCGVIDQDLFAELEELYRFRNVVIHRFIISPIAYNDLIPRLDQYEVITQRLLARLAEIERNDGEEVTADERVAINQRIQRKIHRPD